MGNTRDTGYLRNIIAYDASGNVGIGGAVNGSYKLAVTGTAIFNGNVSATTSLAPTSIRLYNSSDGGSAIEFSNGVNANSKLSFGVEAAGAGTDDSYMAFSTGANATISERMRITSGGMVLIGTTLQDYTAKLQVNGQIWAYESSNPAGGGIMIGKDANGLGATIQTLGANSYMTFYTNLSSSTLERMRIGSDGVVTIKGGKQLTIDSGVTGDAGLFIKSEGTNTGNGFTNIQAFYGGVGYTSPLVLQRYGGNVGIGTTNPAIRLDVFAASGQSDVAYFKTSDFVAGSTGSRFGIAFSSSSGNVASLLTATSNGQNEWNDMQFKALNILFFTNNGERMRIKTDGTVGIGTSVPNASLHISGSYGGFNRLTQMNVTVANTDAINLIASKNSGGSDQWWSWGVTTANAFYIVGDAGGPGGIGVKVNYGATSWSAGSDIRFKDIIEPITNATQKINSLSTIIYKFKNDNPSVRRVGLIAQELNKILPEAVDVPKNNEEMWSVRYTEVVPLVVKGLQEEDAKVEDLKAQVAELQTRIAYLENK